MATVYEGMFLLNNEVVREDWKTAKALVTATIEKHGGTIRTARRWDERPLAYPIMGKKRATYLLAYYEMPVDSMAATRLDFDLSEDVLRYLWLKVDEVPAEEKELSEAENASDFAVPEPPDENAVEVSEADASESTERDAEKGSDEAKDGGESKDAEAKDAEAKDAEGADKSEPTAPKAEEAPAAAEVATETVTDDGSKEN